MVELRASIITVMYSFIYEIALLIQSYVFSCAFFILFTSCHSFTYLCVLQKKHQKDLEWLRTTRIWLAPGQWHWAIKYTRSSLSMVRRQASAWFVWTIWYVVLRLVHPCAWSVQRICICLAVLKVQVFLDKKVAIYSWFSKSARLNEITVQINDDCFEFDVFSWTI